MTGEPERSRSGSYIGWGFLSAVAAIYVVCAVLSPDVARQALASFWSLLGRVLPIFLLVFVLLFLIDMLVGRKWILRYLGVAAGASGWVIAIACGVLSAGPLFAWYPLLADLKAKGMKSGLIAAFLYSRALKLPLLPLMVHYFDLAYTILFSTCILAFSLLSGWLMTLIFDDSKMQVR